MCLLIFKCLNSIAPEYLSNSVQCYVPNRELRSLRDKTILVKSPYNYKTFGARSFSTFGPSVWNKLPREIRQASTITIFKSKLKYHLFVQAFSHLSRSQSFVCLFCFSAQCLEPFSYVHILSYFVYQVLCFVSIVVWFLYVIHVFVITRLLCF